MAFINSVWGRCAFQRMRRTALNVNGMEKEQRWTADQPLGEVHASGHSCKRLQCWTSRPALTLPLNSELNAFTSGHEIVYFLIKCVSERADERLLLS